MVQVEVRIEVIGHFHPDFCERSKGGVVRQEFGFERAPGSNYRKDYPSG
jgi:hypothetical protein